MSRIFTTLAAFLTLALLATMALGFSSFFLPMSELKKDIFLLHFTLGLITAVAILGGHCIIFTYFLGTGRWVKEVAMAYQIPDEPWPKLTRELKRGTFPPALFAMLTAIAAAAAGAGAHLQSWPWFIHASGAFITLLVNLWAFRIEFRNLRTNARVIQEVMMEVDRIRSRHGLVSNAEALRLED